MSSANIVVNNVLTAAAKRKASHVHLTVGAYPALRIDGELEELKDESVVTNDLIQQMVANWLDEDQKAILEKEKEIVISREVNKKFRLKISFFFQKNFSSSSLGFIPVEVPLLVNLGLPKSVYSLPERQSGLIIVAGPFGSGRTTTTASLIEDINTNRQENIVVLEKPIEYLFNNKKSIIEQRQVGRYVNSFADGLKHVAKSDIDVVSVGVNFEEEAIPLTLDFANSGRLAILTMDTTSALKAVEDVISSFKPEEIARAQTLLAESLIAVIVQRLLPRVGGGMSLASEVLIVTSPVKALIREGRIGQILSILQSSRTEGMISLDQSLADLVRSGEVLIDRAVEYANDPDNLRAMIK